MMIRETYAGLQFGSTTAGHAHSHTSPSLETSKHEEADALFLLDHLDHCFDYIRQAIMCAADPAVEPARVDEHGVRRDVDGWGGQHQCRSWSDLVEFAQDNKPIGFG